MSAKIKGMKLFYKFCLFNLRVEFHLQTFYFQRISNVITFTKADLSLVLMTYSENLSDLAEKSFHL